MKRIVVVAACVAFGGIVSMGSAGAHPGVECHNDGSHCLQHCTQFHRHIDTAVCLVTHNFPN